MAPSPSPVSSIRFPIDGPDEEAFSDILGGRRVGYITVMPRR
jgi:hypothetical protein